MSEPIDERGRKVSITPGMARSKRSRPKYKCKECGLVIPVYTGAYPSFCPSCNGELEAVAAEEPEQGTPPVTEFADPREPKTSQFRKEKTSLIVKASIQTNRDGVPRVVVYRRTDSPSGYEMMIATVEDYIERLFDEGWITLYATNVKGLVGVKEMKVRNWVSFVVGVECDSEMQAEEITKLLYKQREVVKNTIGTAADLVSAEVVMDTEKVQDVLKWLHDIVTDAGFALEESRLRVCQDSLHGLGEFWEDDAGHEWFMSYEDMEQLARGESLTGLPVEVQDEFRGRAKDMVKQQQESVELNEMGKDWSVVSDKELRKFAGNARPSMGPSQKSYDLGFIDGEAGRELEEPLDRYYVLGYVHATRGKLKESGPGESIDEVSVDEYGIVSLAVGCANRAEVKEVLAALRGEDFEIEQFGDTLMVTSHGYGGRASVASLRKEIITLLKRADISLEESQIVVELRGQGRGRGGPAQGDGGVDYCVCPECGARVKHVRGTPCLQSKCPKCGAVMVGESIDEKNGISMRIVRSMRATEDDIEVFEFDNGDIYVGGEIDDFIIRGGREITNVPEAVMEAVITFEESFDVEVETVLEFPKDILRLLRRLKAWWFEESIDEKKGKSNLQRHTMVKCPVCGGKVPSNTGYCIKCKKKTVKVKKPKKEARFSQTYGLMDVEDALRDAGFEEYDVLHVVDALDKIASEFGGDQVNEVDIADVLRDQGLRLYIDKVLDLLHKGPSRRRESKKEQSNLSERRPRTKWAHCSECGADWEVALVYDTGRWWPESEDEMFCPECDAVGELEESKKERGSTTNAADILHERFGDPAEARAVEGWFREAEEAWGSKFFDIEQRVANEMKRKGYQFVILLPPKLGHPLFAKTVQDASEMSRTTYAGEAILIISLYEFIDLLEERPQEYFDSSDAKPGQVTELYGRDARFGDVRVFAYIEGGQMHMSIGTEALGDLGFAGRKGQQLLKVLVAKKGRLKDDNGDVIKIVPSEKETGGVDVLYAGAYYMTIGARDLEKVIDFMKTKAHFSIYGSTIGSGVALTELYGEPDWKGDFHDTRVGPVDEPDEDWVQVEVYDTDSPVHVIRWAKRRCRLWQEPKSVWDNAKNAHKIVFIVHKDDADRIRNKAKEPVMWSESKVELHVEDLDLSVERRKALAEAIEGDGAIGVREDGTVWLIRAGSVREAKREELKGRLQLAGDWEKHLEIKE